MALHAVVNGFRNEYDGTCNANIGRCAMQTNDEWVSLVKGTLRAEMTRRGITYDQLAERLAEFGVTDTPVNLRNKVARGGFSAVFFMQCLKAIGVTDLRL